MLFLSLSLTLSTSLPLPPLLPPGSQLMGVWMAINRSGGFHDRLIRQLEPFNATISHLLFAITARKRRREADLQLFASCRQVSRALAAERVMLREALVHDKRGGAREGLTLAGVCSLAGHATAGRPPSIGQRRACWFQ